MEKSTFVRLHREGRKVRRGDRESGIWVCPESGFYELRFADGDGDTSVYLCAGSRLRATWEFRGSDWRLVAIDTDTILPPKQPTSWLRAWKWRLAFGGFVLAASSLLLFCGGG
jgi:hypothetical protein